MWMSMSEGLTNLHILIVLNWLPHCVLQSLRILMSCILDNPVGEQVKFSCNRHNNHERIRNLLILDFSMFSSDRLLG